VQKINNLDIPFPYSPNLAKEVLPNTEKTIEIINKLFNL
jgi:pyruvate/2-oxoglutarate/acetoin dehydrogenase E1 component